MMLMLLTPVRLPAYPECPSWVLPGTAYSELNLIAFTWGYPFCKLSDLDSSVGCRGLYRIWQMQVCLYMLEPLCHPRQRVTGVANLSSKVTMIWMKDTTLHSISW